MAPPVTVYRGPLDIEAQRGSQYIDYHIPQDQCGWHWFLFLIVRAAALHTYLFTFITILDSGFTPVTTLVAVSWPLMVLLGTAVAVFAGGVTQDGFFLFSGVETMIVGA